MMPKASLPTADPPVRSLLVRCVNWIGDAVMTIPALRELRRHQPDLQITLMARPWVLGLFAGQDFMDHKLEASSSGNRWERWRIDKSNLEKGGYDAALILPNAIGPALLAYAAGIPNRWGYARDARRWLLTQAVPKGAILQGKHQCRHYLHLIHGVHLSRVDYLENGCFQPDCRLARTAEQGNRARQTAARLGIGRDPHRPLVGIHAGASYGGAKRWFPERFTLTADTLFSRFDAEVVLIGSEGERALAEDIARAAKHSPKVLAGKTSLADLLDCMSLMDLFLANDSGPMHLAATLDIPLIALFGSTDPVATAPLSPHAVVIRKETPCSPCLLRECPLDLRCFDRISVNEVLFHAEKLLKTTHKI